MKDESGRSKGVGFISYESHGSSAWAVKELNGKTLSNRDIYAVPAITLQDWMACAEHLLQGQQTPPGLTVCITNLEEEIDNTQLRESFNKFGTPTSVKVCSFCGCVLCTCYTKHMSIPGCVWKRGIVEVASQIVGGVVAGRYFTLWGQLRLDQNCLSSSSVSFSSTPA